MTIYYIDYQNGYDSNNGTSILSPKKNFPANGSPGDVYKLKRGSVMSVVGQLFYWSRQGIIFTDYGNPALPKPIVSAIMATGSAAFALSGDTIFHNIHFKNIQRSNNETTNSNTGPNAVILGVRGGGSPGSAEGVSGVFINCDFEDIGNNAIVFNGCGSNQYYSYAAPVGIVLGCTFKGLGSDGITGSVKNYMEVGYCRFENIGTRIEPLVAGVTPPGARMGSADAINTLYSLAKNTWIHDNYIDHSDWDCKHSIMIDCAPETSGNVPIIERNIILGYGTNEGNYITSVNNVGVNTVAGLILRNNYIKSSYISLSIGSQSNYSEVHSNLFDITGISGNNNPIGILGKNCEFYNNNVVGRQKLNGIAIAKSSGADNFAAYRNVIGNFKYGIKSIFSTRPASFDRNAFYNVDIPYLDSDGVTPLTPNVNDIINQTSIVLEHFSYNHIFKSVDKRVPDFWGRFSPAGFAYIGAVLDN